MWIRNSEKVLSGIIVRDLEERGCLTPEVGGARTKRPTTSDQEATTHIIQQGHQHTAVGLFDLEDAYTNVDIGILAAKIGLAYLTLAMLKERKCSMKFGTWRCEVFNVRSGIP
jgi:hypothetical protein